MAMFPALMNDTMFSDLFDDPFFEGWRSADNSAAMTPTNMMSTDVRENDKGYDVDIDMPGFKKDDISVSLNNGYLTVSAIRTKASATRMSPASGFVVNVTSAPARAASTSAIR